MKFCSETCFFSVLKSILQSILCFLYVLSLVTLITPSYDRILNTRLVKPDNYFLFIVTVVGASSRSGPASLLLICVSLVQTQSSALPLEPWRLNQLKYLNAWVVHTVCRALFEPSPLLLFGTVYSFLSFFSEICLASTFSPLFTQHSHDINQRYRQCSSLCRQRFIAVFIDWWQKSGLDAVELRNIHEKSQISFKL